MAIETIRVNEGEVGQPGVAVDTVSGANYQVIKIALGLDGAVDAVVDSGAQTSANSIPVVLASDQAKVPVNLVDSTGDSISDDANNALRVNIVAGGGSGGTSFTDDAAFTAGTNSGTPIMGFVTADAVDSGDVGVLAMDANRNLKVSIAADTVGIGGGIQYTEGDVDASITGTAMLWEDSSDTLRAVSSAKPLPVNAAQSGTWNITNISGTVSLPTGAATAAKQDTGNSSLSTIAGAVAGTEMQVDVLTMPLTSVSDGGGSLTVDGSVSITGAVDTELTTADLDTGAGTDTRAVVGLVLAASGGGLLVGSANPMPISDNSSTISIDDGASSITVDGTITANLAAGTNNIGDVDVLTVPAPLSTTGGGTEATALRVTLANDSTGLVSIDDNGGSLTVDGTVTANLAAGTNNIGDVDVLSVVPGTSATSLGKAEDAAHTTGDVGVMSLGVRLDSGASLAGTDGDYAPFQLDSSGNLRVNVAAGGAGDGAILDGVSGSIKATVLDYTNSNPLAVRLTDTAGDYVGAGAGTQYTEDAAAAANPVGTAPILVRTDTPAGQVSADGDNIAQRGTNYGAAYVQVVNSSGAYVDTFGGGTQYTEDVASAADPVGNQLIARRRDALSSETTADGDNTAVNSTSKGELYVKHVDAIPVTDNAGSLTVDGTVTANAGSGTFVIGDGGGSITIDGSVSITGAIPAGTNNIGDVDVLTMPGTVVEDAASAGAETALLIAGVRNDAAASKTSADGDFGNLAIDAAGRVGIADLGGAISVDDNGSSLTVDGTVAATQSGTWNVTNVSGTVSLPTGASTLAEQQTQTTALQLLDDVVATDGSAALTKLYQVGGTDGTNAQILSTNTSGHINIADGSNSITVDNGGTFVVQENGAALTALQLIDNIVNTEDTASANGDTGVPILATRKATPANVSGTDGDYEFLQMSAGRLWCSATIDAAIPAGANSIGILGANSGVDIGDVTINNASGASAVNIQDGGNSITIDGTVTANAGTGTFTCGGVAAHDAAVSGNPVLTAAEARTTNGTAVASGDVVRLAADTLGKLHTLPYSGLEQVVSGVTAAITGTSNTSVIAAQGASVRTYITQITVTNSHATVGTVVEIKDGTTVMYRLYAHQTGGGATITLPSPLRGTANTAWNAANVTTGSNTYVSMAGFTSTV